MKVDMSPEAVSRRLNMMEQLWELSVALMDSKSLDGIQLSSRPRRTLAIQDSIRQVLIEDWDPIGVRGVPEASDEYDAYIGRLYRILFDRRPIDELVNCLEQIEREEICVSTSEQVRRWVAGKLLALMVILN